MHAILSRQKIRHLDNQINEADTLMPGLSEQAVRAVFACHAIDHDQYNRPKAERPEGCPALG